MHRWIPLSLVALLAASTLGAQDAPPETAPTEERPASASAEAVSPTIVESPIAAGNFSVVDGTREIDTVVVHYTSAIYWFDSSFQSRVGDEGKAYAESIGLTPRNLPEHKYDWQLNKAIFEAYGVSSHYAIARDGTIVRFVAENDRAYHAGKSEMPTDGRTGVNDFSIGIELMASHPKDDATVVTREDAYTEAQYAALNALIADICTRHTITAVVGHDEIAPGRKTDPGPLFQWDRVRGNDYKPLVGGANADGANADGTTLK